MRRQEFCERLKAENAIEFLVRVKINYLYMMIAMEEQKPKSQRIHLHTWLN